MKTAFYFRTREEYEKIHKYILNLDSELRPEDSKTYDSILHIRYTPCIQVYSPHIIMRQNKAYSLSQIPKSVPGKKKYIGIVKGRKKYLKKMGIDPRAFLTELGVEVIDNTPQKSKKRPNKDITKTRINLTSHQHYRTTISLLNKKFGHGGWRLIAPKKFQNTLHAIDFLRENPDYPIGLMEIDPIHTEYIPVTIVVNEPNVDLGPLLFKLKLKVNA